MGRKATNPKKYIVSCRISDQEMEVLTAIAEASGTNISGLLRRSLDLLESNYLPGTELRAA